MRNEGKTGKALAALLGRYRDLSEDAPLTREELEDRLHGEVWRGDWDEVLRLLEQFPGNVSREAAGECLCRAVEGAPPEVFEKLLDHPRITVLTGVAAKERLTFADEILLDGEPFGGKVIYTGALDELFDCRFGRLPYRTLDFKFETYQQEWFQPRGTVNYTVDEDYTRITEFKYFSGQVLPHTTIVKEYSRAYTGAAGEIPYYAVISPENCALYEQYVELTGKYPRLYLLGRLAEYPNYNMDAITLKALELCDRLAAE